MISIVIPVYNEESILILLFKKIEEVMRKLEKNYEVIFINDGSTDNSGAILDQIADQYPQIKVIHFYRNFGQTTSIMAGFDYTSGEIIIGMDSDYQNDPEDIPKILKKLDEGYDVCSGWRKNRKDSMIQKNLPSKIGNFIISRISGVKIHDFGCSLKAYRRHVIQGIRLYGEMHRLLPVYTQWNGAKITEIPVNHFPRRAGNSNYGLERILKVILDILVITFLHRHQQHPMYVFGICGVMSFFLSFCFLLWSLLLLIFDHKPLISTPILGCFLMTFMTGVLCILMGLMAEMLARTFFESQGKPTYHIKKLRNL